MKRILALGLALLSGAATAISPLSTQVAEYSVKTYQQDMVDSLAQMVRFKTVANDEIPFAQNPEFNGFKAYIRQQAEALGLEYQDHGHVLLVALGQSDKRVGIVTHGDVQPADPAKWRKSPFELDMESQPGHLIGRGTEDNKGPIATALYAMKAIKDKKLVLDRRLELLIYLAEESDWEPFREFLKTYQAPQMNITIDASYPVVTAEKGWSQIKFLIPQQQPAAKSALPELSEFQGGYFASQIPEDASVVISGMGAAELDRLKQAAKQLHPKVKFAFSANGDELKIAAKGVSAHSSSPESGVNAPVYLAQLLKPFRFAPSPSTTTVNFINQLIGTGFYAERFGNLGYRDDFMGPMTLAPTVIKAVDKGVEVTLNIRRPAGRSAEQMEANARAALANWSASERVKLADISTYWGEPMRVKNAPHANTLLEVFSHYTGMEAKPVSIGGSTNAKLLPNAVSFGPSMPGVKYTGHSEHEFITLEQFILNLRMYTAAFVELGQMKSPSH